jgi:hypothetical protein
VDSHSNIRFNGSRLWVLCLGEASYQTLVAFNLADKLPMRLADFEAGDPEVATTRAQRSTIEYLLHHWDRLGCRRHRKTNRLLKPVTVLSQT